MLGRREGGGRIVIEGARRGEGQESDPYLLRREFAPLFLTWSGRTPRATREPSPFTQHVTHCTVGKRRFLFCIQPFL